MYPRTYRTQISEFTSYNKHTASIHTNMFLSSRGSVHARGWQRGSDGGGWGRGGDSCQAERRLAVAAATGEGHSWGLAGEEPAGDYKSPLSSSSSSPELSPLSLVSPVISAAWTPEGGRTSRATCPSPSQSRLHLVDLSLCE